jgi:hypothetical protein
VTVRVGDACGEGLQLGWRFMTWAGAGYLVVSGCESGPVNLANATSCTIRLSGGAAAVLSAATAPVTPLAPQKSVDVIVEGRDAAGNFVSDRASLDFANPPPPFPVNPEARLSPPVPRPSR